MILELNSAFDSETWRVGSVDGEVQRGPDKALLESFVRFEGTRGSILFF